MNGSYMNCDNNAPTGVFYDKHGPYHSAKGEWGASYQENEYELDCRKFQRENKDDWRLIVQ